MFLELSEVQKWKSPLDNYHMISTLQVLYKKIFYSIIQDIFCRICILIIQYILTICCVIFWKKNQSEKEWPVKRASLDFFWGPNLIDWRSHNTIFNNVFLHFVWSMSWSKGNLINMNELFLDFALDSMKNLLKVGISSLYTHG